MMRQIIFKEVGMKNYGPYIDEMVLKVNENNLTLITGPNGIGKTMILDAIPFSLYGTTSKGKKGNDVVNNKVGKNCHTWLEFSVDDIEYRVDRYHKHTKFGNTVMLKKNGDELGKGQRELLPLIESIVVPARLFMNTLFFGQSVKTFFTDLTDSEKKDIFRKILDLDKYGLYYDETTKRLKELGQLQQMLSNNLSIKSELIPSLEKQLMLLQEEEKEFNRRKQTLITIHEKELKELKEEINKLKNSLNTSSEDLLIQVNEKISECKSNLESIKSNEENELSSLLNLKSTKKNELNSKSYKMKQELQVETTKQINDIEKIYSPKMHNLEERSKTSQESRDKKEIEFHKLSFEISSLKTDYENFSNNVLTLSTCPTCLTPLDEKGKEHIKRKIKEIEIQISDLEKLLFDVKFYKTRVEKEISNLKSEIQELSQEKQSKINENQTILDGKIREIDLKEQSILEELEIRSKQAEHSIKQKYIDKKNSLIKTFSELVSQKNKYESDISNQNNIKMNLSSKEAKSISLISTIEEKQKEIFDTKRFDAIKEKINSINVEIHSLREQQKQFLKNQEILEFWKIGFSSSGIPSLLIDESIPFMNQRVSYYLDQISNGRYTVSFDTLQATKAGEFRDKISVNVLDHISKANSRIQLSGGQTRIVDIATILTLCDLQSSVQNVTFNLLLFDEIFDSLDDENIGFVSKVLKDLSKLKKMFIISHRYIDQIEADHVISLR